MNKKQQREEECKELLREIVKPGMTVYCNLRHVSRSGMFRAISLHIKTEDGIRDISYPAAPLLEGYSEKSRACKASGCGMDMGFHLVHNLSYALHGQGFECIGKGCPSNEHSNLFYMKQNNEIPPGTCEDHLKRETGVCQNKNCKPWLHKSGGYSLRHEWL